MIAFFIVLVNFLSQSSSIYFKSGDRISFIGDSITQRGDYYHNVQQYYLTHFAQESIQFFNCGIAGDIMEGAIRRVVDDCLIYKPTHAFIMFGMNDLALDANYFNNIRSDSVRLALGTYKSNIEALISILQKSNVTTVVLQTPTLYDQTAKFGGENNIGRNDILKMGANIVRHAALRRKFKYIDYWTPLRDINERIQAVNPNDTIISPDRVHPGALGHLVMADIFLDATENRSTLRDTCRMSMRKLGSSSGQICTIHSIQHETNRIVISLTLNRLPFIFDPLLESENVTGKKLRPLVLRFNHFLFQVVDLPRDVRNVSLLIGNERIGEFNLPTLERGINLLEWKTTPMFRQAEKVYQILTSLWDMQRTERRLKFVEYCCLNSYFDQAKKSKLPALINISDVSAYLHLHYGNKFKKDDYFGDNFNDYFLNKKKQDVIVSEIVSLQKEARAAAISMPQVLTVVLNR